MRTKILQIFILIVFTHLCANTSVSANEDYKYAIALMKERKEYKGAADKFAEFVKANPNSEEAPKALFYMASCLARLGKDNSAGSSYEKIITLYPNTSQNIIIDSYAYGADAYFRAQLYKKASRLYTKLIEKFPNATQVESSIYWSAECYNRLASSGKHALDNPDYQAAINAYSDLEKSYPNSHFLPDALTGAGLLAYSFKDYQTSSEFFSLYNDLDIELEPARQELILYHSAESLYWLKDYKAAAKRFTAVIDDYPSGRFIAESYAGLGWCSYTLGNLLAAGESFKQAAEKYTDKVQALSAHFDAGAAFEEAGAKDKAIEEYTLVLSAPSHPRRQAALVRLGILQKDTTSVKSDKFLSEAFNIDDSSGDTSLSIEAGVLLADKMLDEKKFAKAAKIFSKIIEIAPNSEYAPFALYQLALAQAELKEYKKASTSIKLLLKNYPDSPLRLQAAYAIADYQNILGDTKKSHIAYKWLAEQSETWAMEYTRDHKVENIDKFTQDAKDIAAASLLRLGESLYKNKDDPKAQARAKDYFSDYITRYPDNQRIAAALLRLGELTEGDNLQIAHTYFVNAINSANMIATNDMEFINIKMHAKYRLCLNNILLSQNAEKSSTADHQKYLAEGLKSINEFLNEYQDVAEAKELVTHLNYYKSEAEYSLGNVDAALEGYDSSYLADKSSSVADAALFSSAWIEQEKGDTASSIQKLQTLLKNYKDSVYRSNALYILAVHSRKNKDLITAKEYLTELLQNHPDSEFADKAHIELAKVISLGGDNKRAVKELETFIKNNPESKENPNALYALSWAYFSQINSGSEDSEQAAIYTKVEKILKNLITTYPNYNNNLVAKFRLGEIAYNKMDYQNAVSWYKSTLQDSKSNLADKAHYRLAWCYLKLAKNEKNYQESALKEFLTICSEFPESSLFSESALRAAKLLRQKNDYSQALSLYKNAEKKSNNTEIIMGAKYGQGVTLLQLEEYSNALKTFKEYIASYPESPLKHEANWGAGQAAMMLGAVVDAAEYFNTAKANNYNGEAAAKARFGLGMIAMEKTEFKLAREEFRKVDVFHSEWQEVAAAALLKAAEASEELGEFDTAKNDLKRIIEIYSETSSAQTAEELLLTEAE